MYLKRKDDYQVCIQKNHTLKLDLKIGSRVRPSKEYLESEWLKAELFVKEAMASGHLFTVFKGRLPSEHTSYRVSLESNEGIGFIINPRRNPPLVLKDRKSMTKD